MNYKVSKQYGRGPKTIVGQLSDLQDAKLLIQAKLESDATLKTPATYFIEEFGHIMETFEPKNASDAQNQSSNVGNQSSFRPTPFTMSPRPKGVPPKWQHEDKEKK